MTDPDVVALQARIAALEALLGVVTGSKPDGIPVPPLDSQIEMRRADRDEPAGMPITIIGLVSHNTCENSYAWPAYTQLRVTDHPKATQASSQSTGTQVRMFSPGSGSPWASGSHIELHHGQDIDGSTHLDAGGTIISRTLEVTRKSGKGYLIGSNQANTDASDFDCDVAWQVQSSGPGKRWKKLVNVQDAGKDVADITFDYKLNRWLFRRGGKTVASF